MSFPPEINPSSSSYGDDVKSMDDIFYLYKGEVVYFKADASRVFPSPSEYIPLVWMKLSLIDFTAAVNKPPVKTGLSDMTLIMQAKTAINILSDRIDNTRKYEILFDVSDGFTVPIISIE